MKKLLSLIFAVAFLLGFSAIASATTTTLSDLNYTGFHTEAYLTPALISVSGTRVANISSYTPSSIVLTITTPYINNNWFVMAGWGTWSDLKAVQGTYIGNDTFSFDLTSDYQTFFAGSNYQWYDSPIHFSVLADCYFNKVNYTVKGTPTSTPEPATLLLLGIGLAGLAVLGKRAQMAS